MLQFQSPSLSWIVTPLDVVEDIRSCLVVVSIHPLSLEHPQEALRGRIVGAAAHGTQMLPVTWWASRNRWYSSEVN